MEENWLLYLIVTGAKLRMSWEERRVGATNCWRDRDGRMGMKRKGKRVPEKKKIHVHYASLRINQRHFIYRLCERMKANEREREEKRVKR